MRDRCALRKHLENDLLALTNNSPVLRAAKLLRCRESDLSTLCEGYKRHEGCYELSFPRNECHLILAAVLSVKTG